MPPSASIAVVVNTRSGAVMGHPQILAEIGDLFRAAGHDAEIVALRDGDDPAAAAHAAGARATIVVAAGGDGTVSSVASAVVDSPTALGILPLGTLNHFAKDLQIPLALPEAVAVIVAGHVRLVDVGEVNGVVFVNNSSIGIYPSIVEARETLRSQGHAKWTSMAIATARVLRRYRGVKVSIDVEGRRRHWRTPFVFIGNDEYEVDGIRMGGRARLDAGRLFVYLAPRLRAYQLPLLLAKALLGRARRSGDFEIVPAAELWIGVSHVRRQHVALDGEIRVMSTPLHYRARPKALRIVSPRV